MGVDFSTCPGCDEVFCDVDCFFCSCGITSCEDKCIDAKEDDDGNRTCKFCRVECVTDSEMLDTAIKILSAHIQDRDLESIRKDIRNFCIKQKKEKLGVKIESDNP